MTVCILVVNEDYSHDILGVYDSFEKAEKAKAHFNLQTDFYYCPYIVCREFNADDWRDIY